MDVESCGRQASQAARRPGGNTYDNACEANKAGVSVDHSGECTCNDSSECDPTEYCEKGDGNCGGQGTCDPRPGACLAIFDPVCGCDAMTYDNACIAHKDGGVTVDFAGVCQ